AKPTVCEDPLTRKPVMIAIHSSSSHKRNVKTWPAPIRFFQNKAMAGGPAEASLKGARLAFLGRSKGRCRPERMAVILSAIRLEASTEASSNATSDLATHK